MSTPICERIGYDGPRHAFARNLARSASQHLFTVPFENLDIALGIPISLDPDRLTRRSWCAAAADSATS